MEAPKLPSFIRQNRHKQFDFKPRFYDERKERIEELKRKYSDGSQPSRNSADLRMRMSNEWRSHSRKTASGSNYRLIVIIAALFFITYLILFR